jgi:hypothetical protein
VLLQLSSAASQHELRPRGSGGWRGNAFFSLTARKTTIINEKKSATTFQHSMVHFPSLLAHGKQTNNTVSGGSLSA